LYELRILWNVEKVILLVTSRPVRKVHHRHITQYLKFQGILEFVGHQLVVVIHDLARAAHPEENNVPIWLQNCQMYSQVGYSNTTKVRWDNMPI